MAFKNFAYQFIKIEEHPKSGVTNPALYIVNHISPLKKFLLIKILPNTTVFIRERVTIIDSILSFLFRVKIMRLNDIEINLYSRAIRSSDNFIFFLDQYMHSKSLKIVSDIYQKTKVLYVESILIKEKAHFFSPLNFSVKSLERQKKQVNQETNNQLIDFLLTDLSCRSSITGNSLISQLSKKSRSRSLFKKIIQDSTGSNDSYFSLVFKILLISKILKNQLKSEKRIGVFLPNTNINAVIFFACQLLSVTPCMLNYTSGISKIRNCLQLSKAKVIITSQNFIDKAGLSKQIKELEDNYHIVFLEELKSKNNLSTKLMAILGLSNLIVFPNLLKLPNAEDEACILFTTGSEGMPKGVVLTNNNLLTNYRQTQHMLENRVNDRVLNVLPFFHSFGLMAGLILPVFGGTKVYQYPNPLHAKEIVKICREKKISILWGTPTFLRTYAEYALTDDFQYLNYVVSGAERLSDEIRDLWMEKFQIQILEGYGATEASPVISVNTKYSNKIGTVGKILPLIEYDLKTVKGIDEAKELWVKGPNIMKGYLGEFADGLGNMADDPALPATDKNWYATGDLVTIDENKFITIVGRRKRFAKLGGEMVSLGEIESVAKVIWPKSEHAAITVQDEKNLEIVVLFTTQPNPKKTEFLKKAKDEKISNLLIPKKIEFVDEIPVFGSGKTDYQKLLEVVQSGN